MVSTGRKTVGKEIPSTIEPTGLDNYEDVAFSSQIIDNRQLIYINNNFQL